MFVKIKAFFIKLRLRWVASRVRRLSRLIKVNAWRQENIKSRGEMILRSYDSLRARYLDIMGDVQLTAKEKEFFKKLCH